MATIRSIGRFFVVYGLNEGEHPLGIEKVYVVEDTEWRPDENHRDGLSYQVCIGRLFAGVGSFNKPLSDEMLDWIEEQAVWLDEVEPADIASWRGSREREASQLGLDYRVHRAEADQGAEAAAGDEHDAAQGHV